MGAVKRSLPVTVLLALLAGACQGEMDSAHDTVPVGDTVPADMPPAPSDGALDQALAGDEGSTGDGVTDKSPANEGHGPCDSWSAWTCQTDPVYLCKASCKYGNQELKLNCVSSGNCVCGVSISPCGPFTAASPCDACKQAVEQGCCQ